MPAPRQQLTPPLPPTPPTADQQQFSTSSNFKQLQATSAQSSSKSTACCGHELATYPPHALCRDSNFLKKPESNLDGSRQKLHTSNGACTHKQKEELPEAKSPQPSSQPVSRKKRPKSVIQPEAARALLVPRRSSLPWRHNIRPPLHSSSLALAAMNWLLGGQ